MYLRVVKRIDTFRLKEESLATPCSKPDVRKERIEWEILPNLDFSSLLVVRGWSAVGRAASTWDRSSDLEEGS